tara:strand:+ start:114 stop:272 length:159 start_codon:yes stop_codon:yes gene_type:complete
VGRKKKNHQPKAKTLNDVHDVGKLFIVAVHVKKNIGRKVGIKMSVRSKKREI